MGNHTKQGMSGMVLPYDWTICRRPAGLRISVWIAIAVLALLSPGCNLDTGGGKDIDCTDGQMTCEVSAVDYSFTTKKNSYRFKGYCYLTPHDTSYQTGDPLISFDVKGVFTPSSGEFQESGEFSGHISDKFAIAGHSGLDPWLYPYFSTGVTNISGDPYSLARTLCIYEIPGQYYRIPFSRNVIVHILHEDDLQQMREQSFNPDPAPEPPAPPPCPQTWVTGPPEVVVPVPGAVYGEGAKGIMALLQTKCGAENIKYKDEQGLWSWYIASLEYEEDNVWKKGESVTIRMSSHPDGGSGGVDTLPIKGPGHWRVRANQLITQKHNNEVTVSEHSDWTAFWVGKPQFEIASMDFTKLKKMAFDQQAFQEMDHIWETGKFTTMTFRPMPQGSKGSASESILGKEAAKVKPAKTAARQPSETAKLKPTGPAGLASTAAGQPGRQPGARRIVIPAPRTPAARMEPSASMVKPPQLEFEDTRHVKTLTLTAGKSSAAVFQVLNTGDLASEATTYTVNCKKLSNAATKCPDFNKRGSLAAISAQGRRDVEVKLASVVAGEYELEITLANGTLKTVKLKVAEAEVQRAPGASRSTPKMEPEPRSR
jgi:hypothetical protein